MSMRNYYFTFILLTVLVITAIFYGFSLAGSPFTQKQISQDAARVSGLSSLKNPIQSYYTDKKTLPRTLQDLLPDFISKLPVDPQTKQPYDYKTDPASPYSYSLCATFARDTKDSKTKGYESPSYIYEDSTTSHAKGYDCLNFKLPSYITSPYLSPTPRNSITPTITTFGLVDSIADSTINPRIIISDNKIVKIFNLNNTEIVNKSGTKITISSFLPGDKVIVDSVISSPSNYTSYNAIRLQNLSR